MLSSRFFHPRINGEISLSGLPKALVTAMDGVFSRDT
jgi:hypothetical protein